MIVKQQKPIRFVNEAGCLLDKKELEKAILWFADKPVISTKKIFMHGSYPAVAIHKEKIHVHRLLMMYWEGRKLDQHEVVHHKNECKINALRDNLELINHGDHNSMHMKGRNFTPEHKKRISDANIRRAGKVRFKKKLDLPAREIYEMRSSGGSISAIARHFKVDRSTIKNRLSEHPHLLEGDIK